MLRELNTNEMELVSGGTTPLTPGNEGILGDQDLEHARQIAFAYMQEHGDVSLHEPDMGDVVETNEDSAEIEEMERALEVIARNTPDLGAFDRVEFDNATGQFRLLGPFLV